MGDIQYTVFLHRLNDGLKVALARRHVFQNDAVFDTLTVCQCIANTESVVKPGTESVLTNVLFIINIISVLTTVLINDVDAEHIPDDITPVVEGALGNIDPSADVISQPQLVQFFERDFTLAIDGFYHPDVFGYETLSSFVVHISLFFAKV